LGASVDPTDARKTRLRPEVRKAWGIATGSTRQRFPSDPRPSPVMKI
jgi:hypothetical protein